MQATLAREPIPLVGVSRSGTTECRHRGSIVVYGDDQIVECLGNPSMVTPMRSTAKPFQILGLLRHGGREALELTDSDIAIMVSSHNGEPIHVRAVQSLLARVHLDESALACGTHPAFYPWITELIFRETGHDVRPIHNNCSGKHAGMLLLCALRGLPLEAYWTPPHPVQQEIMQDVADAVGVTIEQLSVGIDGCGVPTYNVTLLQLARAYYLLAVASSSSDDLGVVYRAMSNAPEMVAGTDRLDTALMRLEPIVSKVGSDGIFCLAIPARRLGIAVKIESGSEEAAACATVEMLQRLGALSHESLTSLEPYWHRPVRTCTNVIVGNYQPLF